MRLHTASEGITFTKKLENDSAKFYEDLSKLYKNDTETFLLFTRENKKNIAQIERTYYGVITDAIEGCFAFDIDPEVYSFKVKIPEEKNYVEILNQALTIEDKITNFYLDAANQSMGKMADIPRIFLMVAKKRQERILKLKLLIKNKS
jgi:hypothetical protein